MSKHHADAEPEVVHQTDRVRERPVYPVAYDANMMPLGSEPGIPEQGPGDPADPGKTHGHAKPKRGRPKPSASAVADSKQHPTEE